MSNNTKCETFEWCTVENGAGWHRYKHEYGIEFIFDEADKSVRVSWEPDWNEWEFAPVDVRAELRGLRHTLAGLEMQLEEFCVLVGVAPAAVEPAEDLRPCAVVGCLTAVHPWLAGEQNEPCVASRFDHPEKFYTVQGSREVGASEWATWVDVNGLPDGREGIETLQQLSADFVMMQEHCDKLNADAAGSQGHPDASTES